jgi:hypothetical protein
MFNTGIGTDTLNKSGVALELNKKKSRSRIYMDGHSANITKETVLSAEESKQEVMRILSASRLAHDTTANLKDSLGKFNRIEYR